MFAALLIATLAAPQDAPSFAQRAEPRALLEQALEAYHPDKFLFGIGATSSHGVECRVASQSFWTSASPGEALNAPSREQLQARMEERREAVRRAGNDWRARMEYADALGALGRVREATDQRWEAELMLREARAARPQDCELALEHASALRSLGRKPEAEALLDSLAGGPCASRAAIEQIGLSLSERWSGAAATESRTALQRLSRWQELEAAALRHTQERERDALAEQFCEQRASRLFVWAMSEGVSSLPPPPALIAALEGWLELLRGARHGGESARSTHLEHLATEVVISLTLHLIVERERLGAVLDEIGQAGESPGDQGWSLGLELLDALEHGRAGRSFSVRSLALGQLVQDWREANAARFEIIARELATARDPAQLEFHVLQRAALLDLLDGGARFGQLASQRNELSQMLASAPSAEQPLFLGVALLAAGRIDECVDVFGAWLSTGSEQQRFLEAARMLVEVGLDESAEGPSIAQAEQLAFPTNAIVLGVAHGLVKQWSQARDALRAAVSQAQDDALAWQYLGYAQLSEPATRSQAEASFAQACALPGDHLARSKVGLALAAAHRGRADEARAAAFEAALLAPRDPLVRAVEALALETLLQATSGQSSQRFNLASQCMRACVAALSRPSGATSDDEDWRAVVEVTIRVACSFLSHEPQPPAHEREALRQRAALLDALAQHWRASEPRFALEAARTSLALLRSLSAEGAATGVERRAAARLEFDLHDEGGEACAAAREALDGAVAFARGADVEDHLLRTRIELACGDLERALESLELAFAASKAPEAGVLAALRFMSSFAAHEAFDSSLDEWIEAARRAARPDDDLAALIGRAQSLAHGQLASRPDAVAPKVALARLIRLEDRGEAARERANELLEEALAQVWIPSVPHLLALLECAIDGRQPSATIDYGLALLRQDAPARERGAPTPPPGFNSAAVHEVVHALAHEARGEFARVLAAQRRWAGGDAERMLLLAQACATGSAPAAPDCECSLDWLARAAGLGDARYALVWIEEVRLRVRSGADAVLLDAPIAHVRELDRRGDLAFDEQLGLALWERGVRCGGLDDLRAAWPMLVACAESERPEALHALARIHRRGEFVEPDVALARELYVRSAELGSGAAATELGVWLLEEPRDARDPALGRAWVERAANWGFRGALETLVPIYERGLGGPVELELARQLRAQLSGAR